MNDVINLFQCVKLAAEANCERTSRILGIYAAQFTKILASFYSRQQKSCTHEWFESVVALPWHGDKLWMHKPSLVLTPLAPNIRHMLLTLYVIYLCVLFHVCITSGWHTATLILLGLALLTAFLSVCIGLCACCYGSLALIFTVITLLTSKSAFFYYLKHSYFILWNLWVTFS